MSESATLQQLAEERASVAEGKVATLEAQRVRLEVERDTAVKTAEANEVLTRDLVARIEDVARDNGRKDGVIEVLKGQIREKQTTPQPAPTPAPTVVHHTTSRTDFWRRFFGWLFWILVILLLGYWLWTILVSRGMLEAPSQPNAPINYFSEPPPVVFEEPDYADSYEPILTDPTLEQWKADCEARGATFYTADEWNARGGQPHADPGMTFCHVDAVVKVY